MIGSDAILDVTLATKRTLREREASGRWSASSLGYCQRRQFFQRAGIPETNGPDDKAFRIFAAGDLFHEYLRESWRVAGLLLEPPMDRTCWCGRTQAEHGSTEWHLGDKERNVSGYLDGLIVGPLAPVFHQDGDMNFAVAVRKRLVETYGNLSGALAEEYKSMNSRAIERAYREGPQPHHMIQLAAYKLMADTNPAQLPVVPEEWRLTYVGKDSLGILSFPLTSQWVEKAATILTDLNLAWAEGVTPECTCAGWMIRFCPFSQGKTCCQMAAA
jgi:hypothetical protein